MNQNGPVECGSCGRATVNGNRLGEGDAASDLTTDLIAVIDASTKTFKTIIYRPGSLTEVAQTQHEIELNELQLGWFETDPTIMMSVIRKSFEEIVDQLRSRQLSPSQVRTFGVATQRESVVAWHRFTGEPLYNIILWYDYRTDYLVKKFIEKLPRERQSCDVFREKCGLPISSYFSALKIRWLIDNVPKVAEAYEHNHCCFGTIDSWIVWNLTGRSVYVTDVTNASRTLLMNLETLDWDNELLNFFELNRNCLPRIVSNSEIYGYVKADCEFDGTAISALIGNQQAALIGHSCLDFGSVKNTYRRGCFILCNTGTKKILSKYGLLTTVAYKLGPQSKAYFALEGSIAIGGEIIKWLRDNLHMIESSFSLESTAQLQPADHNADICFVPAFNGLFAPYWRPDARGTICGLSTMARKEHIIRAAYEAICFQTRDILEAIRKDLEIDLGVLNADGIMTQNDHLMQIQADINGSPCIKLKSRNVIGLGTAMIAGQAVGIDLWSVNDPQIDYGRFRQLYRPKIADNAREQRYRKWKMAVQRALGWNNQKFTSASPTSSPYSFVLNNIPIAVFFVTLFGFIKFQNS